MQRVGADHKYQKILLIIWIFVGFSIGSAVYSMPFLFLQHPYKCPSLTSKECQKYVCSLPLPLRSRYQKKIQIGSLANVFGDYHCENKGDLVKAESLIYIGGIAGVLLGAVLSSYLSKKRLFLLTVIISTSGILLTLFSPSLPVASIGLFLNYACKCIQIEMIYCFITETVDQSKRGKHQLIIFMFEAFGSAMNGPIYYFVGSWKAFLIGMYIIPGLIILGFFLFFVKDTIFDSLMYHSPEETLEII